MASAFGGVFTEAKNHNTWNKTLLQFMGERLFDLETACVLSGPCEERAFDLAKALGLAMIQDEVSPELVGTHLSLIAMNVSDLADCLFDIYAISSDVGASFERRFTDWPDADFLQTIEPERVRTVR
jgi:hypothetical protein